MAFMRQLRLRLRCGDSSLPPRTPVPRSSLLLRHLLLLALSPSLFLGVDARYAHVLEARSRAFSGPLRSAIPLSRFLTQVAE